MTLNQDITEGDLDFAFTVQNKKSPIHDGFTSIKFGSLGNQQEFNETQMFEGISKSKQGSQPTSAKNKPLFSPKMKDNKKKSGRRRVHNRISSISPEGENLAIQSQPHDNNRQAMSQTSQINSFDFSKNLLMSS